MVFEKLRLGLWRGLDRGRGLVLAYAVVGRLDPVAAFSVPVDLIAHDFERRDRHFERLSPALEQAGGCVRAAL